MNTILESNRLTIREFSEGDLCDLAKLLADPKVMEFSLKGPLDLEGSRCYLEDRIFNHYKKYGYGLWALIDKNDQKLIGLAGPIVQQIEGKEYVEIGYRWDPNYWGKGLATEAVAEIRDYLFKHYDLDQIIALIDPKNIRSARVASRSGYKLSKNIQFHGFNVDFYVYNRSN